MRKQPKALSLLLAMLALLCCCATPAFGAPAVTQLRTLIIHADTLVEPAGAAVIADMEGMVFNDATNISDALFDATYGHYRLIQGPATDSLGDPVKSITVDLSDIDPFATTASEMETLMASTATLEDAFTAIGATFNVGDYDRFLICLPFGTQDNELGSGLEFDEAFGYYTPTLTEATVANPTPTPIFRSVYGYFWTGTTFDGILFGLGNNFGFGSSGQGANAFGDNTCAMGKTHFNEGNVTATYGAVKKYQAGWFSAYPNTTSDLTQDATINLYPISQNPDSVPGMRMVSINGTNYRISYRRQFNPYAWLEFSSLADQVYVHSDNGLQQVSNLESQLSEASSTLKGSTVVYFESYGPGNAYATVSFDLDDGNTRPVADSQFISMRGNRSLAITLSGSDADDDSLNYEVLTNPGSGTLTGTAPNLTYTPPTDFLGQVSFTFRVDDGKIGAVGTITINVTEPNIVPVADDFSITAFYQTPEPLTLTASDGDSDPLTFIIVDAPTNGVLSGAAPDLIYTPNNGFSGADSFTFKVNDFYDDSATATVTIDVLATPNTPPSVNAGADKAIDLQLVDWAPGLHFGMVAGYANNTAPNPKTQIIADVAAFTEDGISENTTEIFTGQIYDADGLIRFTEHMDDRAVIKIDGVIVHFDDRWDVETTSPVLNLPANPNLPPGWHDIEIRISNRAWGSGPLPGNIGIGYDPDGGTNFRTMSDSGDGTFLRAPLPSPTNGYAETLLDDATVTDPEHAPSYLWTVTSTGNSSGTATFSNPYALNPTVYFTKTGIYVLRLTADDGYAQVYDEVTITVSLPGNNDAVVDAGANQTVAMTNTVPWTPDMLEPLAWYDATVSSTVISGSLPGFVSQWIDRSGNGNHMIQGELLKQPSTGSKSINGNNAIGFDGLEDALLTATNPFGATINDAMIISVVNLEESTWDDVMFSLSGPGGSRWQAHVPLVNRSLVFDADNRLTYGTNWNSGENKLLAFYGSTSDNVRQMWANGSLLRSANPGYAVNTGSGMALGFDGSGYSDHCTMGEVIILNGTVSAENRQRLEGYLAHKWGMTADLPAGHPYKTAAPLSIRAVANLNTASVSDPDSHPVTAVWSLDSGPAPVALSDTGAVNPTVTFREPGTYVLRLDASDPYQLAPSNDTVTITVQAGAVSTLTVVGGTGASGGGSHAAGFTVPIEAGTPSGNDRFFNWTSSAGGFFGDANSPSTTFTMPFNDVTVTANFGPNNQPVVDAGSNQNAARVVETTPGLYFGEVAGNINLSTPNPQTSLITNVASKTEDGIAGNTTEIYTGQIFDADGQISFTERIDDRSRIWIDGVLVLSSDGWSDRVSTGNLNLTPGWHNIEIRISNGSGGSGPVSSPGIGYDPNGGTAWQTLADPGDGSFLRVGASSPSATINLNGTVTDADGDSLTTIWSVVSTVPAGLESAVTFADASRINTSVTFSQIGTYTLQLTANDGYGVDVLDTVVITVSEPAPFALTVNGGSGGGTHNSGSAVEITAAPPAGDRFVSWTTSDGGSFADAFSATTTYTMPANNATVTASFETNTPPVVNAGLDISDPFDGRIGEARMILLPSDSIQGFQSTAIGGNSTDGNFPSNESPQKAIDGNTSSKYLNFGKVGSGFHITPGTGRTMLTGVRIVTANDRPNRDPLTISIEGSNGGDLSQGSSWTLIQNNINLGIDSDPGRNVPGPLVAVPEGTYYAHYRVIVQSMRGAENSVQYAEIELHGYKPATSLFALSGTASDDDGDPLTTTWSLVSKPVGATDPVFGDPSQLETSVSFTDLGTYRFRLTADDGYTSPPPYDEVDVTVTAPPTYTLAVTNGTGAGTYLAGDEISIVADAPAAGDRFVNWTTSAGGTFGNPYKSATTYIMPASNVTLTANYGPNTLPVVVAGGNQTVSFNSSVPWTPAWAPSALSTKAWYDASDEANFTLIEDQLNPGTGGVAQWHDKSGNGNHLYQTGAGSQPYYGTQFINGVDSVFFDGADSMRQIGNALGSQISEATLFTVWELEEIVDETILQLDPERFTFGIRYGNRLTTSVNGSMSWDSWMEWYYPALSSAATVPFMINPRYSVSENSYRNYVNGTADVFKSGGTDGGTQKKANGIVTTTAGMELLNFRGKCGEVIVMDEAIDETNRQKVEGYLAHKWGLDTNLPEGHPYKAAPPVEAGVVANLNGSATDADGDLLTVTWTVVSKDPVTAADPFFANPSSPTTTVTFTEQGTYVLRLTANDGNAPDVTSELTITVGPEVTSPYDTWAAGFGGSFTDTALTSNPDGDWMTNLMEFALGTNPTVRDGGPLATNGSAHGAPILVDAGGGNFEFYFMRRKDFGTSGSANYIPQFSANLASFTNSGATPTWVADSTTDPTNYEVVKVPYLEGTRFGRLEVSAAP